MKTMLCAVALALASASAFAIDYPEERGLVPSVIPPAPDESGVVNNVPVWRNLAARDPDWYFARYDTNRDGVISWEEAQQDPDLARVFDRADANGDRVLSREEFHDAAVLAVNENRARRGG